METFILSHSDSIWASRLRDIQIGSEPHRIESIFPVSDRPLKLLDWVKFLRRAKKKMILFWPIEELENQAPFWFPNLLNKRLIARLCRVILKTRGGPGIIIYSKGSNHFLTKVGDVVLTGPSVTDQALKMALENAYVQSECGSPDTMYRDKLQKNRLKWLKKESHGKVLEIGCSTGFVLDYLGGGTGIDLDPFRVSLAQKKYPHCKFVTGDASKLPFSSNEFDTVLIPEILEHVDHSHARKIVDEAKRVGKKMILTVPNAEKINYRKDLVENPEHRWFPTKKLVRDLVGPNAVILGSPEGDFIYAIWNYQAEKQK